MSFRLFLRCCLPNKSKDHERKTEIAVKKVIYEGKDNSYDKSDIEPTNPPKKDCKEAQQSQQLPDDLIKPSDVNNMIISNKQPIMHTEEKLPEKIKEPIKLIPEDLTQTVIDKPSNTEALLPSSFETPAKKEKKEEEIMPPVVAEVKGKSLILKIVESNSLQKDFEIKILPVGYPESKRLAKDCKTFFGTVLEGNHQNEPYTNDFVIPSEENGFGKRHFVISFVESLLLIRRKQLLHSGFI